MGDSMDTDLLPELSGETWVAATYMDELNATGLDLDFVVASRQDVTLATVRKWVQSGTPLRGRSVWDYLRSCGVGGSHGTCRGGPPIGSGGHESSGHVSYYPKGQLVCPGHGGLFLSMDGGLSVA